MSKKNIKGYVILGILFALVSVIAFAVPSAKTTAFWVSYGFTALAFAAQIFIWKAAFGHSTMPKSKFLGFSIVYIGVIYLVIQIITLAVFLFCPTLPVWCSVVACAAVFGVSAVCMISADVGRSEIERVSAKVQEKTFYLRQLQADVEALANAETDSATKSALTQLAEKIRYSDPMSDERLVELEEQITARIAELKSSADKVKIIDELTSLLDERNRKCKILK